MPEDLTNIARIAMLSHIGNGAYPTMMKGERNKTKAANPDLEAKREMRRMRESYAKQVDRNELLNSSQVKILYPQNASEILKLADNRDISKIKVRGTWHYDRREIKEYMRWKEYFSGQQKLF